MEWVIKREVEEVTITLDLKHLDRKIPITKIKEIWVGCTANKIMGNSAYINPNQRQTTKLNCANISCKDNVHMRANAVLPMVKLNLEKSKLCRCNSSVLPMENTINKFNQITVTKGIKTNQFKFLFHQTLLICSLLNPIILANNLGNHQTCKALAYLNR